MLRRWVRPGVLDVQAWDAPAALSAPATGAVDERPVLAASGRRAIACWVRTTDLGAYGSQRVWCRRSQDRGATWGDVESPTPAAVPGVPYGPYVGGVAVAARRGVFNIAWIDTYAGALDGSGRDAAWVARDGEPPRIAARFEPLAERFARDRFRNVGLLSLAAGRDGLYLAYAAGHADVRVVRSTATGWGEPVDIGADAAEQFQPSVAVTRDEVHVFFLDRRLDPSGTFVDEWLASSSDGGATWTRRRLSHDSWDAAVGAPHSPTGDLLGDHQALVADACGPIAVAADTHRANALSRDLDFDKGRRVSTVPQLFAWRQPSHVACRG
jgi:hypothetical protein